MKDPPHRRELEITMIWSGWVVVFILSGATMSAEGGSLIEQYTNNLPPELHEEFRLAAKRVMEERLQVMRQVIHMPEDQPHYRMRRQTPGVTANDRITRIENDFFELVGVIPFASLGLPLYKNIKMADFDDYLLVAVVTGTELDNQNKTVVFKVYDNATVEYLQMIDPSNLAVQSTAIFLHEGEDVRLALAGDNGAYVYEFSRLESKFIKIQEIPAMDVFLVEQMQMLGDDILVLGLQGPTVNGSASVLAVYRWMNGYFDKFFEKTVPYMRDICPYEIQGHYFLAIAVQEFGKMDYPDLSFIMRYDQHAETFIINQYVPTHGARDFEFFSISSDKDQEFFLVLANDQPDESGNERSIVYKYTWPKFVPFQCLETHGASQWQPIKKNLDVVLILASSHGIVFYQYDGWRFSEVALPGLDISLESKIQSFAAVVLNGTEYLAISSLDFLDRNSRATIFQLEFNETHAIEDYQDLLEAACRDEHEKLDRAIERIENVTRELPKLVYVNVNYTQEIEGNITFTENITALDASVQGNISADVGHIFNTTEADRFAEMEALADEQSGDIDWLEERMDNMMKTIGVQTITAQKTFYDFTSTSELDASSVAVTSDIVNGFVNLTDTSSNIFRTDANAAVRVPITVNGSLVLDDNIVVDGLMMEWSTMTVTVPITVDGSLVLEDTLEVNGLIDGVDTDDLVTLSGTHTIISSKTFLQPTHFSGDIEVDGLIDGVELSAESVLLTRTNQTIEGVLTMEEPVTFQDHVTTDGKVDGVDISEIEAISVYKTGSYDIQGMKTFEADVTSLEGLTAGGSIDGVSVEEMNDNILRLSTEQNVTGTYTFTEDMHIVGDMLLTGTANGLELPADILLSDRSEVFNISATTTFTAPVRTSDIEVEESVDGVDAVTAASGSKSLDLLLTSTNDDQVLMGPITLTDDLTLSEDSTITGLVDGVDLSELSSDAVKNDDHATITGFKTIEGPVVFDGDVAVSGLINNVNISEVDERVLRITDAAWSPEGGLIFTATNTSFSANLETYNEHSFDGILLTDLAIQGINETIGGYKIFLGMHSQGTINLTEEINGVSIDRICREAVYLNNSEALHLYGDISIEEDLSVVGNVTVNGTIDGVDLNDVVTLEGTQTIEGSTSFHSDVKANELSINGSVYVSDSVNGDNVTELALDTLYTHGDQSVTGHKTFLEDAIFDDDLEVGGSVDNVDVSELASDAIYQTGDHAITANKTFASGASVGSFDIEGLVNRENLTEFTDDIVLQDETQTIDGNVTFQQTVELNSSLSLEGALNGVDLVEFNLTVHRISDDQFTGVLRFADVYCNASVNVDGLVNGIDVGGDTLTTNGVGQTVTGVKTFTNTLTSGDDLNSTTVNDINIQELDTSVLKTVGDQNVTGYYKFWDGVTWVSNATLEGLIDGVDIVELANSIWRTDGDTDDYTLNVTGNGTFNILTSRDIYYNGTIDGVDIPELNRTYVSLSTDQTITGKKRFLGEVVIPANSTLSAQHIAVEGSIQDLDLKNISDEAFISGNAGQEITGELIFVQNVTFEGDVTVDGTVDGVDISDDVMVTDSTNIVGGHKTFNNSLLEINSSLVVAPGKTVQSVDVSEMERLSAGIHGNHTILNTTSFRNLTLQNINITGELNGINYTTNYILTERHDQFIYGNYTFANDTVFSREVNASTINGLVVVDLANNTLFITGNQTVTGNITINDLLLTGNVTTHGLFGGVVVTNFYQSLSYYPELGNLGDAIDEQCQVLDELHYSQQNQAVILRGLRQIDGATTTGKVVWLPYQDSTASYAALAVSPVYDEYRRTVSPEVCASLSIKRWNSDLNVYETDRVMTFDLIEDIELIAGVDIEGIAVAERQVDAGCFTDFGDNITELAEARPPGYTTDTNFWVHTLFTNGANESFHQLLLGVGTSTIEVFDDRDEELCVFVGNELDHDAANSAIDSFIYCFNQSSGAFEFTAGVSTFGIVKASHFTHAGASYLLVANRVDTVSRSHQIDSTLWAFVNSSSVRQVAQFPTRAATYVTSGMVKEMRLIVYLNEFEGGYLFENFEQTMDIYRFDGVAAELYQQVPVYGAKAATFVSVERMDLLAVVDRNSNLTLYKYEGIQQFVKYYTLHVPGAADVDVMTLNDQSAIHLFVATTLSEIPLFPWQQVIPVPSESPVFELALSGKILDAEGCSLAPEPT